MVAIVSLVVALWLLWDFFFNKRWDDMCGD